MFSCYLLLVKLNILLNQLPTSSRPHKKVVTTLGKGNYLYFVFNDIKSKILISNYDDCFDSKIFVDRY